MDIKTAVLTDGDMRVSLLNYGAVTQGWWYKGKPLILGYDDPGSYESDVNYMGAIVGRVANRIAGAQFRLGDERFDLFANEGDNTLHGGSGAISHQLWAFEDVSLSEAILSLTSQDRENGFPGSVEFRLRVTLEFPRLTYEIDAVPDRPTPISIAQHNYYSLGCTDGVSALRLKLAAKAYLETDDQGPALGRVSDVGGGSLDFGSSKLVGDARVDLDHYYCFEGNRPTSDAVAELTAASGLRLSVFSDQPGAQVYSGSQLSKPFRKRAGICIEPSGYPNAVNVPLFPSVIYTPDTPYRQVLTLEITEV